MKERTNTNLNINKKIREKAIKKNNLKKNQEKKANARPLIFLVCNMSLKIF